MLLTGGFALMLAALLPTVDCGGSSSGSEDSEKMPGDITIASPTTWSNKSVAVTGKITIVAGGSLTLDHATLLFEPEVEDSLMLEIQDGGSLHAVAATLKSGSGKQYNVEVHGTAAARFEAGSFATNHSGLRFYDTSTLTADASDVEEVQVHDKVTLNIQNGAAAYVVCFFTGNVTADYGSGEFAAGSGISRDISVKSAPGMAGSIHLANADISGFQLDLVGSASVSIAGGSEIVLALHLEDYVNSNFTSGITNVTGGSVDFSASGNPKFQWTNSQISAVNLYLGGSSDVIWNGPTTFVEVNAMDSSRLTLNGGVKLWANLLETYNTALVVLNGVTLLEDEATFPSITAEDKSSITINNVAATANTQVYRVDSGKISINGGSGW
ncbi:MAG TPA: hypothetical protein DF383_14130 [Deltaproteobacteria bacterium]|nr:hypothetical protein [Deltaproteobacteria bacterium]